MIDIILILVTYIVLNGKIFNKVMMDTLSFNIKKYFIAEKDYFFCKAQTFELFVFNNTGRISYTKKNL
jgi:hypothetical protein